MTTLEATIKTLTKKLGPRSYRALVRTAAELIEDSRSAHDLAVEFGVEEADVRYLQQCM